jgi:hypothetical protein
VWGDVSVACSFLLLMNEYVMGGARELALFDGAIGVYPAPLLSVASRSHINHRISQI